MLKAFFDADALGAWWQAARSVTTPRVLGAYAIEWASTDFEDDILGRLGGVFRGTVMQFDPGRGFLVADAFWLPPDGDPIGPMALEVTCSPITSSGGVSLPPTEIATERPRRAERVRGQRALAAVLRNREHRLGARPHLAEDAAGKVVRPVELSRPIRRTGRIPRPANVVITRRRSSLAILA